MSEVTLHLGDCIEYMRGMDAGSVDAVVTDPPYGIDKEEWDDKSHLLAIPEVWRCCGPYSPGLVALLAWVVIAWL